MLRCRRMQGLWLEAFTGLLGGSRDPLQFTDPAALEEGVRAAMGSLAVTPHLPAFLLAPVAALLVGALEGSWFLFLQYG